MNRFDDACTSDSPTELSFAGLFLCANGNKITRSYAAAAVILLFELILSR